MKTQLFTTTIKCAACVTKVTPALNETVGEGNWTVDIQNPAKILRIESEASPVEVTLALEKVGYKAKKIELL